MDQLAVYNDHHIDNNVLSSNHKCIHQTLNNQHNDYGIYPMSHKLNFFTSYCLDSVKRKLRDFAESKTSTH